MAWAERSCARRRGNVWLLDGRIVYGNDHVELRRPFESLLTVLSFHASLCFGLGTTDIKVLAGSFSVTFYKGSDCQARYQYKCSAGCWPDQSSHFLAFSGGLRVQRHVAGTNGEAPTSVGVSFCFV